MCGNIVNRKDRVDLALESARRVEDFNELTHHYLSVIGAKCTRVFGAMSADPAASEATGQKLTEQMQAVRVSFSQALR